MLTGNGTISRLMKRWLKMLLGKNEEAKPRRLFRGLDSRRQLARITYMNQRVISMSGGR